MGRIGRWGYSTCVDRVGSSGTSGWEATRVLKGLIDRLIQPLYRYRCSRSPPILPPLPSPPYTTTASILCLYPFVLSSVWLVNFLLFCLSVCLSVGLSVCLSVCLSICLSVCLSVCLSLGSPPSFCATPYIIFLPFCRAIAGSDGPIPLAAEHPGGDAGSV